MSPINQAAGDRAQAILDFWFLPPADPNYGHYRKRWFIKDPKFDSQIRAWFLADVEKAAAGEYANWLANPQQNPHSAVALLLLLDQFPRNLYRGSAKSFATDAQALKVAKLLVDTSADKPLLPAHRFFIYVPFEHSENLADQNRCVALMKKLSEEVSDSAPNSAGGLTGGLDYAIRHRDVIERFGRFPHRNEILSRASTPEEIMFLQQPGSRF